MAEVSLFQFWWNNVRFPEDYDWYGLTARDAHLIFNEAFVSTFPKLLYTNPFTSYSHGSGIITSSQLRGTGETTWSKAQVRAAVIAGANAVGIVGNPNDLTITMLTISQIQQGQTLTPAPSPVTSAFTTDGAQQITDDAWALFWKGLGFATVPAVGTLVAVGLGYLIINKIINK